jgi:hypothetical protein
MALFILLTSGQADAVRGVSESVPYAALDPVEREGDVYILGVEVLADPAHATHHDYLAALPCMDDSDLNFPQPLADVQDDLVDLPVSRS